MASITVTRLPESIPPTVSTTNPANGAVGVAVNATLNATFSENLDPASVTSATFKVTYGSGTQIPGSVTYSGHSVHFTATNPLVASALHTATLTTGIRDESGNPLVSDYVWTFTTGASSDVVPPALLGTDPADGTVCFPVDGTLSANFSELLDASSVGPGTFLLNGTAGAITGRVALSWDGVTASFSPYSQLANGQTYTATLSGQIKDLAGNAVGADHVWSFTTAPDGIGAWHPTSQIGAPLSRGGHTTVWTGTEMIVWGGTDGSSGLRLDDGARYNPTTDSWTPMSSAPIARTQHVAVWTGSEMIVWGGFGTSLTALPTTGAIYAPATNSWRAISSMGAPSGRTGATALWTGTEMIVWGGYAAGNPLGTQGPALGSGSRYNPASDTWQPISSTNAPEPRSRYSAVWTGSRMIIWGGNGPSGFLNTGVAYDPATDTWQSLPTSGAPTPRAGHSGTWTGLEMLIWGGAEANAPPINTGARYDPAAGTWRSMASACAASARAGHAAVWTGSELVVWGGGGANTSIGGRFNPTLDDWLPVSVLNQPTATGSPPPTVWTGTEMIVWSGYGAASAAGSGARYLP